MEPLAFVILCVVLVIFLEEIGVIIMVCLVLYNCTGDDPKIKPKPKQNITTVTQPANNTPHYELVEQYQEGDPICENGYQLMVDTKTGNKACILGSNHY